MVIPVGSAFTTELERESGAKPVILIFMNFTTGARRFAMWPYDVTFAGNTFFGLGPIAAIDPAESSASTPLTEMFLDFFVQNDPDLLADLQQNSRERRCVIRLVFVDGDNAAIDNEAIEIADRQMIPGRLRGGRGTYRSQLGLESRLHRHRLRAPRTYSDSEQRKTRDSTDRAFRDMGKNLDLSRPKYRQKSGLG